LDISAVVPSEETRPLLARYQNGHPINPLRIMDGI
jgi:hypothetical protein